MKTKTLKAVLDFLIADMARPHRRLPHGQKVYFTLDDYGVKMVSTQEGGVLTMVVFTRTRAEFSSVEQCFSVPFREVLDLLPPLRSDSNYVAVKPCVQPITKRPCLKFTIGDWFDAWLGDEHPPFALSTPIEGEVKLIPALRGVGDVDYVTKTFSHNLKGNNYVHAKY